MAATTYPANFAHIQRANFTGATNMGVRRVSFESGYSRQRKRFDTMPTEFNLGFVMEYNDWGDWMTWVNQNAYTWFSMDIPNQIAAAAGNTLCNGTGEVRFISDITWSIVGEDSVQATVAAEIKV